MQIKSEAMLISNGSSPMASALAYSPFATLIVLSPLDRVLFILNPCKEFTT
jgi:hypothetical protein